jgi:prophage antirepressor-like protein
MRNKQHEERQLEQLNFEFSPQSFPIQIELKDGEPIFSVKDVCDVLELQNPSDIVTKTLDKDEYLTYTVYRAGQNREMLFVTESGLYTLVFQSRKPEAKRFRKWVTNEVLPSIRKTGSYGTANVVKNITGLLPYVDQVIHDGQPMYAGYQLMALLGRSQHGGMVKKFAEWQKEGLAQLMPGGASGMTKWYIGKKAVGRLLKLRPTTIEKINTIKQLKEGGLL